LTIPSPFVKKLTFINEMMGLGHRKPWSKGFGNPHASLGQTDALAFPRRAVIRALFAGANRVNKNSRISESMAQNFLKFNAGRGPSSADTKWTTGTG
jgi:hypothetical protein